MSALKVLAEVFVHGHAKTKGSLTVVTKRHVKEKQSTYDWMELVRRAVKGSWEGKFLAGSVPFEGRVGVWIVSYMQRDSIKTKGEERRAWLISEMCGDVDKLARCVLDALQESKIIGNDAQVVDLTSSKRLCKAGELPGQMIKVYAIPEERPW